MLKYVVFDFDGTLVDSRVVFISAFNQIAAQNGFKQIDPEMLEHLKKISLLERFKIMEVPLYKLPFLTNKFLTIYRQRIHEISLAPGIEELLEVLGRLPLKIGIVSSNSAGIIRTFLQQKNITSVAEVFCSRNLFGKDKVIKQFLKKLKLQPEEILYIGDEWRDMEACRKINVTPIWVAWGYEDPALAISDQLPEIVATPTDLLNSIKNKLEMTVPVTVS